MSDSERGHPETQNDEPTLRDQTSPHHPTRFFDRFDVRVALMYGVVATLWIFFSDSFVNILFAGDQSESMTISMWKGWGFVFITTLALFAILSTELQKRTRVEHTLRLELIRRIQVEKSEREQHRFVEAMRDSLEALTSTLDVNTVMSAILDQAEHVLPYDGASILQLNGNRAHVVYCRGFPSNAKDYVFEFSESVPLPDHFAAIKMGKPYLINDTSAIPGWANLAITTWVRSTIGVPIILRGGNVFGVIAVDSMLPNRYTNVEVEHLQAFARYAALALEKAYRAEQLEQRVAERTAELLAAKERTEAILNNSMDSILLLKTDLSIQQTSSAFNMVSNWDPSDLLGQSLIKAIHADDVARVLTTVQTVLAERQGKHLECRMLTKERVSFDAELSLGYIDSIDGQEHGLVCTIRDISERKAAERQLRYHASLQETVTDAVITTDMDFHIQAWNRAAETIYGWREDQVLGKPADEVLKTKFLNSETAERVAQEFLQRGYWTDEVIQHHQDGHPINILSSTVLFKNEQGVPFGIVAVNHNISARKQMEQALRDALAKEKELNELKSRFVSMASHEFRTPLATLLALTDTLSHYRHKMTIEQIESRFQKMRDQIARLTEFMEDVLNLTRMQAKKAEFNPAPLNLVELCHSIVADFQGRLDVKHHLVFIASEPECVAPLDKKLMWHLLNNLLSNALKYSAESTTVTVGLTCVDQDIELSVQDEGIGIPEADLKQLFEPFHRAANVGTIAGTGLGLVIAKESVELHGGTLTVASQVGVGTNFTIRLPMVQAEGQDPNPQLTSS